MLTVAQQTNMKIRLEDSLKPDIKRVFNRMIKDFRISVGATGSAQNVNMYLPMWTTLLNRHYIRVQTAVLKVIDKEKQLDDEDNDLLLLALLTWREQNAGKQSQFIINTSQQDMLDALQMAREEFLLQSVFPSDRELAMAAAVILKRKFNGRGSGIAMSETQSSFEDTKFEEAQVESGLLPIILGGAVTVTTTKKTWNTVGDDKVRKIHQEVNRQEQMLTVPYEVNGEFLMYPGDSSLGASMDNVINCRCASQVSF